MRLKIASLAFLFADVILFFTAAYMLARAPVKSASREVHRAFVLQSYIVVLVLLLCLFVTVILVWMWAQQVREEYRTKSQENLQSLIEGTLRDHERKNT